MKILAIETSCDETSAAVVADGKIVSNVVWSQVKLHAKWGGVVPSIAKRGHEEKIDEIVGRALEEAHIKKPDYVAVTVGPGLAIALEVGITKAKELCKKWGVPLIAVNHIEGHLLSCLAGENVKFLISNAKSSPNIQKPKAKILPAVGLVVSGGHTEMVYIEKIGKYKIIGSTQDDALGEALDKGARMLDLGYPGGPVIEKQATKGDRKKYQFTLPYRGRENEGKFSYSGLKTALWRLTEKLKEGNGELSKNQIQDLAASYQDACFEHLIRVVEATVKNLTSEESSAKLQPPSEERLAKIKSLLVGGGVIFNKELRGRLENLGERLGIKVYLPEPALCGDNAGMIGLAGYFKAKRGEIVELADLDKVDRRPRWRVDEG